MPCRTYTDEEERLYSSYQDSAKLIDFIRTELGFTSRNTSIERDSENPYCTNKDRVPQLCNLLKTINPLDKDRIINKKDDEMSERLRSWIKEHEEFDRKRIVQEEQESF